MSFCHLARAAAGGRVALHCSGAMLVLQENDFVSRRCVNLEIAIPPSVLRRRCCHVAYFGAENRNILRVKSCIMHVLSLKSNTRIRSSSHGSAVADRDWLQQHTWKSWQGNVSFYVGNDMRLTKGKVRETCRGKKNHDKRNSTKGRRERKGRDQG